ncbi:histidine phosphatase family protein [Bacillus sp. Marseille-Q1617]|uniref:histidine phosphatase family protein n=1 Tax=Bacillus sp. Marseille-Q1617 TaxID=2736887 RepID=UPI00158C18B5|nr:histidine phosphatase family protein [Bacillus sp. Marseille-Q1617]
MKTNIYFVRHAHSVYTPEELERPLSERGRRDAARVTTILKDKNIQAVCSSPYKRAIETVQGTASYYDQEIEVYENMKERTLSEKSLDDFEQSILRVWQNPDFSFDGGESNREAQKRGIQSFMQILEKYEGKNAAIGTHGNIMVLIMNHFDESFGFEFWNKLEMPDIYKMTFEGKSLVGVERVWN